VTVHGRTGPQIELEGIRLIGRPVPEVELTIEQYVQDHELGLRFDGGGAIGIDEFSVYVRDVRAGDIQISGARFEQREWYHYG
jgi:hypothetical protein